MMKSLPGKERSWQRGWWNHYQVKRGHDSEDDEPEPEHDVDLLVDDVQGKDAHGVVSLNCAGGTIFVEGALGDSVKKNIFTNFK